MITRRPPLPVQVAVAVLCILSGLVVIAAGWVVVSGPSRDLPVVGTGTFIAAIVLLACAAVLALLALAVGRGSRVASVVCLFFALNWTVRGVAGGALGPVGVIQVAGGAALIVSLLWPSSIRHVWRKPATTPTT